jgi:hypothetical protein
MRTWQGVARRVVGEGVRGMQGGPNPNTTQKPRFRCRLKAGYPNQRVAVIIEGMHAVYRDEQNAQKRAYREHVLNVCAAIMDTI